MDTKPLVLLTALLCPLAVEILGQLFAYWLKHHKSKKKSKKRR